MDAHVSIGLNNVPFHLSFFQTRMKGLYKFKIQDIMKKERKLKNIIVYNLDNTGKYELIMLTKLDLEQVEAYYKLEGHTFDKMVEIDYSPYDVPVNDFTFRQFTEEMEMEIREKTRRIIQKTNNGGTELPIANE